MHLAKKILPISLKKSDQDFWLGELSENSLLWTQNSKPTLYSYWWVWQISFDHAINPVDRVELILNMISDKFKVYVIIR